MTEVGRKAFNRSCIFTTFIDPTRSVVVRRPYDGSLGLPLATAVQRKIALAQQYAPFSHLNGDRLNLPLTFVSRVLEAAKRQHQKDVGKQQLMRWLCRVKQMLVFVRGKA